MVPPARTAVRSPGGNQRSITVPPDADGEAARVPLVVPASVSLVDTGAAVARRLEQLLAERGLLAADGEGGAQFWSSAAPEQLARVLPALWGEAPAVLALP